METVEPDSDYEASEAETDAEVPAHNAALQPESSHDENQDIVNVSRAAELKSVGPKTAEPRSVEPRSTMPKGVAPASKRASGQLADSSAAASMPKKKRRRTGAIQEGTYIGGGCRMMCYCPKHSHVTQRKLQANLVLPSIASAIASQNTETISRELKQQPSHSLSAHETAHLYAATKGTVLLGERSQDSGHQAGCIRGMPYNHACRRGQREPDAIAAALAKRLFVSKTPYLISAARQYSSTLLPATQQHTSEQAFLQQQSSKWQALGHGHAVVKTQTERFKEMQLTVARRLTCGKSAIHGLGAFTKTLHQAGKTKFNHQKQKTDCLHAVPVPHPIHALSNSIKMYKI